MQNKNKKCPTCKGDGEVVTNAGKCGGCEICGREQEEIIPCPDCDGTGTVKE